MSNDAWQCSLIRHDTYCYMLIQISVHSCSEKPLIQRYCCHATSWYGKPYAQMPRCFQFAQRRPVSMNPYSSVVSDITWSFNPFECFSSQAHTLYVVTFVVLLPWFILPVRKHDTPSLQVFQAHWLLVDSAAALAVIATVRLFSPGKQRSIILLVNK